MSNLKPKILLSLAMGFLCVSLAHAQTSTNSGGGSGTGSGGSIEFSVGQVVYTTGTGSEGSVAQGVQHTYQIVTFGTSEIQHNLSLSVFPNPSTQHVTLQVSDFTGIELEYQLVDLQGKMLSQAPITLQQTAIDLNSFPAASYTLHVVNQENKKIQSFKIVKIN